MNLCSVNRAVTELERGLLERVKHWQPCFDWIPRPMACGQKYFLILFSGHRRFADIASWMEWQGDVCPISIDLAIDQKYGSILDDALWRQLIVARKVVGAHAAPPCENYTLARWLEVLDGPAPRPLRDMLSPWGKDELTIQEVMQCFVGTQLIMKALALIVLTYCYGGSFTLEHPKGAEGREGRWTIWESAMVNQLGLTLCRARLGSHSPNPLPCSLAGSWTLRRSSSSSISQAGGRRVAGRKRKRQGELANSKGKGLPPTCVPSDRGNSSQACQEDGHEADPALLAQAVAALSPGYDPYLCDAKGTMMTNDYWKQIG